MPELKSDISLQHFDLTEQQLGAAIGEAQRSMARQMRARSLRPAGPLRVTLKVEVRPEWLSR